MLVSRKRLRQSLTHCSSPAARVPVVMSAVTHFLKHMSVNWVTDVWIFALDDSCWMNARTSLRAPSSRFCKSAVSMFWLMVWCAVWQWCAGLSRATCRQKKSPCPSPSSRQKSPPFLQCDTLLPAQLHLHGLPPPGPVLSLSRSRFTRFTRMLLLYSASPFATCCTYRTSSSVYSVTKPKPCCFPLTRSLGSRTLCTGANCTNSSCSNASSTWLSKFPTYNVVSVSMLCLL